MEDGQLAADVVHVLMEDLERKKRTKMRLNSEKHEVYFWWVSESVPDQMIQTGYQVLALLPFYHSIYSVQLLSAAASGHNCYVGQENTKRCSFNHEACLSK